MSVFLLQIIDKGTSIDIYSIANDFELIFVLFSYILKHLLQLGESFMCFASFSACESDRAEPLRDL